MMTISSAVWSVIVITLYLNATLSVELKYSDKRRGNIWRFLPWNGRDTIIFLQLQVRATKFALRIWRFHRDTFENFVCRVRLKKKPRWLHFCKNLEYLEYFKKLKIKNIIKPYKNLETGNLNLNLLWKLRWKLHFLFLNCSRSLFLAVKSAIFVLNIFWGGPIYSFWK